MHIVVGCWDHVPQQSAQPSCRATLSLTAITAGDHLLGYADGFSVEKNCQEELKTKVFAALWLNMVFF
ncbi:MAG TPA: hypothetical protein EYN54_13630 [Methylococcaceae bacterium]|jgi:hypothetical protein|nr:hypothetical protein [Methylococcaceae bacterium]HIO13231.1 hypothetical protein [Methylococcales bacterium]